MKTWERCVRRNTKGGGGVNTKIFTIHLYKYLTRLALTMQTRQGASSWVIRFLFFFNRWENKTESLEWQSLRCNKSSGQSWKTLWHFERPWRSRFRRSSWTFWKTRNVSSCMVWVTHMRRGVGQLCPLALSTHVWEKHASNVIWHTQAVFCLVLHDVSSSTGQLHRKMYAPTWASRSLLTACTDKALCLLAYRKIGG